MFDPGIEADLARHYRQFDEADARSRMSQVTATITHIDRDTAVSFGYAPAPATSPREIESPVLYLDLEIDLRDVVGEHLGAVEEIEISDSFINAGTLCVMLTAVGEPW